MGFKYNTNYLPNLSNPNPMRSNGTRSIHFDGINQHVVVGYTAPEWFTRQSSTGLTVNMWIKADSVTSTKYPFGTVHANGSAAFECTLGTDKNIGIYNPDSQAISSANGKYSLATKFHMLTAVYDPAFSLMTAGKCLFQLYINGNLIYGHHLYDAITTTSSLVPFIGAINYSSPIYFKMWNYETAIWNQRLEHKDVLLMWNDFANSGEPVDPRECSVTPEILHHYDASMISGTTLINQANPGTFDGSLENIPTFSTVEVI